MANELPPVPPNPAPTPGDQSIKTDRPTTSPPVQTGDEAVPLSALAGMTAMLAFYGVVVAGLAVAVGALLGLRYLGVPFIAYAGLAAVLVVAAFLLGYRVDHALRGPAARATRSGPTPHNDGFREVVETIVFVVVLVLLLKSFAAEAFVIPTGSMAETLWGYQKVVTCPSCKYQFPVNASQQVDPTSPPTMFICGGTCPNCRQNIVFGDAPPDDLLKLEHN